MYEIDEIKNNQALSTALSVFLRGDFCSYFRQIFYLTNGSEPIVKDYHKRIFKSLENIALGKNKKRNLMINMPVGAGKSLIVQYFISWCFARSINQTFCYVSHSDQLINKLSNETKGICLSECWQLLFGQALKSSERAKTNWSFEGSANRTGLTAGSIGSGLTGLDAGNPNISGFSGALIADDVMDAGDSRSVNELQNVIDIYTGKLISRRRTMRTPTILIMQRLNRGDLCGYLLATEPDEWDVLTIKAMSEDGTSFYPERYPVKELEKIKRTTPFVFYSQYQQEPIVSGGEMIKREWIKFYPLALKYKYYKIIITADTASKVEEHNDYSVLSVWGVVNGSIHLLECVRGKWQAPDLIRQTQMIWEKWRHTEYGFCSGIYIEDKDSGTMLIQGLKATTGIPILPFTPDNAKYNRLEGVISYIEAGRVLLPQDENYNNNPDLISEMLSFSMDMKHKHDDFVDTMVMAILKGIAKVSVNIFDCMRN